MRNVRQWIKALGSIALSFVAIYFLANLNRHFKDDFTPADERLFIGILQQAQASFARSNDVARNYIRSDRKSAICDAPVYLQIKDWVGQIHKIRSTLDGDALIDIKIADKIYLVGLNGISAAASSTVIKKNTALFQQVVGLRESQYIKFSGTFFTGEQDCFIETSLTQRGSIEEPEFLFRLFSISTQ